MWVMNLPTNGSSTITEGQTNPTISSATAMAIILLEAIVQLLIQKPENLIPKEGIT